MDQQILHNSQVLILELVTIDRLSSKGENLAQDIVGVQTLPPVPSPRAVGIRTWSDTGIPSNERLTY